MWEAASQGEFEGVKNCCHLLNYTELLCIPCIPVKAKAKTALSFGEVTSLPLFISLLFKLLPILSGITWVCNFLLPPLCLKSQQASSQEEHKRDGLLRLGKIWRKVAKNHPDTLSVNTSCVSWVAVFVDCRLWDTKFTPLLEFQPHYFPLSHSRSCLHANRLVLISCSLSIVKTKITLKKLTGEYLFGYTTQGWVTFENITANWISMTSFTHLWPNCKTLSHKSTSLRCQILAENEKKWPSTVCETILW